MPEQAGIQSIQKQTAPSGLGINTKTQSKDQKEKPEDTTQGVEMDEQQKDSFKNIFDDETEYFTKKTNFGTIKYVREHN